MGVFFDGFTHSFAQVFTQDRWRFSNKNTPLGVLKHGGGGWIWTNDLLVMGQTSYQAALPRDICE